jgi:hypothetical protein
MSPSDSSEESMVTCSQLPADYITVDGGEEETDEDVEIELTVYEETATVTKEEVETMVACLKTAKAEIESLMPYLNETLNILCHIHRSFKLMKATSE